MQRGIIASLAVATLVVGVTPVCAVDEIFQTGKANSAKGSITEITKAEVTIKPRIGSAMTIPANEIDRVRWDGEPPKLNLARSAEAAGRLSEALKGYNEVAKDSKAKKERIRIDIQFLIARTIGTMALNDPAQIDDAIKRLEDWILAQADNFHFYEATFVLGRVYMAQKDYVQAKMQFDVLTRSPWEDCKMAGSGFNARILFLQGDVPEALQAFQKVIDKKATTQAEKSRRYQAMLGKAACLTQQQKFDDASKSLDEVVKQASPEDRRVQAEAYVRQGDCLRAQGKSKQAILAYLHIPVLFSSETDLHAESLHRLGILWDEVGKPERGADARQELQTRYPDTEWAKKLSGS